MQLDIALIPLVDEQWWRYLHTLEELNLTKDFSAV